MIMLRGVSMAHGNDKVLKEISLTAQDGKVTVLLGPSGSGKSAVCDILCGVCAPDSGSVLIDGCDLEKDPIEAKRKIGYMPQDPAVFRDMTIRGQLKFIGQAREMSARSLNEQVEKIIKQAKLSEVANTPIRLLSEANLQRVGIAQALMGDVPNLVIDAPTKPLDAKQAFELREIIKEACAGRTVLLSTSNLTEAAAVGEDVYLMDGGAIVGHSKLSKLVDLEIDSEETIVKIAAEEDEVKQALSGLDAKITGELDGIVSAQVKTGAGIEGKKLLSAALAKAGLPIVDMRPAKRDLAQIILKLENEPNVSEGAEAE